MSEHLNRCHFGDARDVLRDLASAGVRAQTCVTSPPYFGLRDYGGGAAEIGAEQTTAAYVEALVEVFRAVRDVLADDGTLWLNLGDAYGPGKQLLGMPWQVALALQADGWVLRQDIIWNRPNPMPESVRDRCTKAHEYLFLLSKKAKYHFDADAIKEPATGQVAGNVRPLKGAEKPEHRTRGGLPAYAARQRSARDSFRREGSKREQPILGQSAGTHRADRAESDWDVAMRNKRSVWTVPTRPYGGAHFAVFPPALVEPCVLAGCPAGGVVLDPFLGSGTTAEVAERLGRRWVGVELNRDYEALQNERIRQRCLEAA